ncbi:MAG: guanine-specific ribonuclease [Frankiales bacterium]|nr:guanine-specific ribonuclease [Frankiales bacterium]
MPDPRTLLRRRPLLALIILLLLLGIGYGVRALDGNGGGSGGHPAGPSATATASPTATATTAATHPVNGGIALSALPPQAADTVRLIERDGPYPNREDGEVFDNAERHLPIRPNGYYHEYTVATPGSADRGARRIITGSAGQYYYTADHYDSFISVDVSG